jgi:hypothetical protein
MIRPIVLDPRLANLESFAQKRAYPFERVPLSGGIPAGRISVPQVETDPSAEMVLLFFVVNDELYACVPNIFQLPAQGEGSSFIRQILDARNFARGLAHFGVDFSDGEVRCTVQEILESEPLSETHLERIVTALCAAVEWLGETLGDLHLVLAEAGEAAPDEGQAGAKGRRPYLN